MLLEQLISIITSFVLITAVALVLLTLRFSLLKRRFLKAFYETPSIIVTGPNFSGKKSLITNITNDKVISHPLEGNLKLGYLNLENKKMQLISLPYNLAFDFIKSDDFKRMNKKLLINVFDVSSESDDIENQVKNFNKVSPKFDGINKIIVANKIDVVDNKKLSKLRKKFQKIFKTSSVTNDGLEELKSQIVSKY